MRRVPDNQLVGVDLVPLFKQHLELCNLQPGETIIAFTNTMSNSAYVSAVMGAAKLLEADYHQITVAADDSWMESKAIISAWENADMVIGLLASMSTHWIYSNAHNQALDAGTRTLMIEEPEDVLRRLFPTPEHRRRGEFGQTLLAEGESIRVTSEAGTDLTLSNKGRKGSCQYGYTDTPGRWDNWPSATSSTAPLENSAEGRLVVDIGDAIIPFGGYAMSPIHFELREGSIVSIEGGADARLVQDFFEAAKDDRAYGVSHIGWGNDERAVWNTLGLRFWEGGGVMDTESYYGNMLIAFGSNFFRKLGGENRAKFHFDIPTRNHSFWIDDTQVLDCGEFVIPELMIPGSE